MLAAKVELRVRVGHAVGRMPLQVRILAMNSSSCQACTAPTRDVDRAAANYQESRSCPRTFSSTVVGDRVVGRGRTGSCWRPAPRPPRDPVRAALRPGEPGPFSHVDVAVPVLRFEATRRIRRLSDPVSPVRRHLPVVVERVPPCPAGPAGQDRPWDRPVGGTSGGPTGPWGPFAPDSP